MQTRITRFGAAISAILLLSGLSASPASAQSTYIAGVAFADIKQFDSIRYDSRAITIVGESIVDGTAAGGGIRIGTFLHPRWSLELGVEAEGRTETSSKHPYPEIFAIYRIPVPELSNSTRFTTVNTVIGFHPPKIGRVQLGYLGGFSFVRGTYVSTLPDVGILAAASVEVSFIGSSAITGISSRPLTFPALQLTTSRRKDNAAGAVMGFEAAIDATSHLSVVPGIRAIVFSNIGRSVFLIRPEVGARWNF